jgi:rubrerythrin
LRKFTRLAVEDELHKRRLTEWVKETAGPSTTLLRRSGRDDNSVVPQQAPREILDPSQRIVIPTGAPKERSEGTCGFLSAAMP